MASRNWIPALVFALGVHGVLFFSLSGFFRSASLLGPGRVAGSGRAGTSVEISAYRSGLVAPRGLGPGSGGRVSGGRVAGGGSPVSGAAGSGLPVAVEPVLVGETQPPYPAVSRRLGEEGDVGLLLKIGQAGEVLETTLLRSSGFARLDDAALQFGRAARFRMAPGTSAPVEKRLTLRFRLAAD